MKTSTVTIPKKEHEGLVETRMRYDYFCAAVSGDIFSSPPSKSASAVL